MRSIPRAKTIDDTVATSWAAEAFVGRPVSTSAGRETFEL